MSDEQKAREQRIIDNVISIETRVAKKLQERREAAVKRLLKQADKLPPMEPKSGY